MISFSVNKNEALVIHEIARRAWAKSRSGRNMMDWAMDITACHANGTPLRLLDLLGADDFNFAHDVFGIERHLDRETGELDGRFMPRFAKTIGVRS